jgi:hypothetical protein
MATDILILGSLVFDSWSTPERMPFGGRQEMAVHQLPGGARVIDTLGPVEKDIMFTGQMYGNNAYGVADELELFPPGLNRLGFPKAWKSDS